MKAILVIDIVDKAFEYYSKQNPKALTVDLMDHVGESRGFYRPKFISLKPMPQARDEHCRYDNWGLESIINAEHRGFNKCLHEITGETE